MKNQNNIFCKKILFVFLLYSFMLLNNTIAQFAPQVGIEGTTAIHADSNLFVGWANDCSLKLGLQLISDSLLGYVSVGSKENATGKADGRIISLGDKGEAILFFKNPIINGDGFDFAVFENGFRYNDSLYFLELAMVEVSSNGLDFVRFEPISNTQTVNQVGAFEGLDASKLHNLAGKYIAPYGTPFDLDELKNHPLIDVNHVHYIKIIDVVGSVNEKYGTKDKNNNIINDPWPTPFASSGFDLDAVGVINQKYKLNINEPTNESIAVYPNPVKVGSNIHIKGIEKIEKIVLTDLFGNEIIYNNFVITAPESRGIYLLIFICNNGIVVKKLMVY